MSLPPKNFNPPCPAHELYMKTYPVLKLCCISLRASTVCKLILLSTLHALGLFPSSPSHLPPTISLLPSHLVPTIVSYTLLLPSHLALTSLLLPSFCHLTLPPVGSYSPLHSYLAPTSLLLPSFCHLTLPPVVSPSLPPCPH